VRGAKGVVASGHQLATLAGIEVLQRGGNAIDAGVAAGICLNVLHHDKTSFAGVAPTMVFRRGDRRVRSISGVGRWPRRATLDYFWTTQRGRFREGITHSIVPGAADAWLTVLRNYGTLSLADVMERGLAFAADGFSVHDYMAYGFSTNWPTIRKWPSSAAIVAPRGQPLTAGELMFQHDLAGTFRSLLEEERAASGTREERILAARNRFYRGDIAEHFVKFSAEHGGLFELSDFEDFGVSEEEVYRMSFGDFEVYACGPWSQGPVLLQALAILKHCDVRSMIPNTAEYIHAVVSALDLAFADREYYYGDPEFVDVPMSALLDDSYASLRAALIDPLAAWPELPAPGDPVGGRSTRPDYSWPVPGTWEAMSGHDGMPSGTSDTSYVCVVDSEGNMFSATPSDTFIEPMFSPIVPGLGLSLSGRGNQSRLDPQHPAALAPWKRPRITPCPALVLKRGQPFLAIGSPGGDTQPQAILQVLLNVLEYGMDLQRAVDQPRFASFNFPMSFYPFDYAPGSMKVEPGIKRSEVLKLRGLGHRIVTSAAWRAGSVCAAGMPSHEGVWQAAADSRYESLALAF
jgi:gamma-glutamyltranspeptidase / glutathione hydrolase